FDKYGIEYKSGQDLKTAIVGRRELDFFKTLNWLLKLTLQMRYSRPASDGQSEEDYILSPIRGKDGKFFDSRDYLKMAQPDKTPELPVDADANGAYHIALKGLWMLQNGIEEDKTRKNKASDSSNAGTEEVKYKLKTISNDEWFTFAVDRHKK
ncbi:MAG: hypothetical protein IKS45_10620, partial [Thermoguttaceae bacterium]|nr:hypothetical protein [Thermoguttaceae bacterium]